MQSMRDGIDGIYLKVHGELAKAELWWSILAVQIIDCRAH